MILKSEVFFAFGRFYFNFLSSIDNFAIKSKGVPIGSCIPSRVGTVDAIFDVLTWDCVDDFLVLSDGYFETCRFSIGT